MLASSISALALAYLAVAGFALGRRHPGFSHFRHTISELGERGARNERLVAYGVFLPVGLAFALVAMLTAGAASMLAVCIAVGYVGAALFPCDPGSPMWGSGRQAVHNLAGAVEYIGGGLALLEIGGQLGWAFKVAGPVVLGAAVGLSVLPAAAGRGALQRVAELCLFGGLWLAV